MVQSWSPITLPVSVERDAVASKRRQASSAAPDCLVPWDVRFYEAQDGAVPARDFLQGLPLSARVELRATLDAVAEAPPPQFSGGLRWHVMRGDMSGYYEARTKDGQRLHRLFCVLERHQPGLDNCSIVVLTGMTKPIRTAFSRADYQQVRDLGETYRAGNPRRVAAG